MQPSLGALVMRDHLSVMALGLAVGALLPSGAGLAGFVLEGRTSLLGVVAGGIVAAITGIGLLRVRVRTVRAALAGPVARATVVGVMASGSKARVSFRYEAAGRPFEGAQTARFERVPAVGDVVEVAYDPERPDSSVLRAVFED